MGAPQNGWFIGENPIYKWIIWGCPYFGKPPLSSFGFVKISQQTSKKIEADKLPMDG